MGAGPKAKAPPPQPSPQGGASRAHRQDAPVTADPASAPPGTGTTDTPSNPIPPVLPGTSLPLVGRVGVGGCPADKGPPPQPSPQGGGSRHRPPLNRLLLAFATGAAIAAGQAPLGFWWLALPLLALLFHLIDRERHPLAAAWIGWLAGAGYFAAAMFWIVEPFMVDAAKHGWMAPFALLFLGFGMGLFWALAAWLGSQRRLFGSAALPVALALTATELLRSYLLTGLPWALIGHIWIDTPLMQLASLVGPLGLTLVACISAALPVAGLARSRAAGLAGLALAALILGTGWLWGQHQLATLDPPRSPALTVRLVQPNAPQNEKWREDRALVFLQRQLSYTAVRADPQPDVVIWPETAVPYLLDQSGPVLEAIAEAAQGTPVILGLNRAEGDRYYNSLIVTGPAGAVTATYDKHHLVPFGEYFPGGNLASTFGLTGFASRQGDGFSAGKGATVLNLGALGKVLPLICYEAVFPQDLNAAPERPDWVVQITNDAWFGSLSGPWQHLAQARLRAVEQGLPLVRAANTGISAVIDARGRITRFLPLDTTGYADAQLPPSLPPTLYSRTGDIPVLVLLCILGLGLLPWPRRISG